ncbi:MAG: HTH domain-containing protein [Brachymonas sp.]|nr:HTH domain-containing protein [Brachymonas sp.]
MTGQQIILTTPDELAAVMRKVLAEHQAMQARKSQRPMTADDLAKHYGCSTSTIWRRVREGRLPQPIGRRWTEGQIARWDNDRAPQFAPHNAPQTS